MRKCLSVVRSTAEVYGPQSRRATSEGPLAIAKDLLRRAEPDLSHLVATKTAGASFSAISLLVLAAKAKEMKCVTLRWYTLCLAPLTRC